MVVECVYPAGGNVILWAVGDKYFTSWNAAVAYEADLYSIGSDNNALCH